MLFEQWGKKTGVQNVVMSVSPFWHWWFWKKKRLCHSVWFLKKMQLQYNTINRHKIHPTKHKTTKAKNKNTHTKNKPTVYKNIKWGTRQLQSNQPLQMCEIFFCPTEIAEGCHLWAWFCKGFFGLQGFFFFPPLLMLAHEDLLGFSLLKTPRNGCVVCGSI